MDKSLEVEEAKFISLYCSDYIRDCIESIEKRRENFKSESMNKKPTTSSGTNAAANYPQQQMAKKQIDQLKSGGLSKNSYLSSGQQHMLGTEKNSVTSKALRSGTIFSHTDHQFKGRNASGKLPAIFQHPPAEFKQEIVQSDDTFHEKRVKAELAQEKRANFSLAVHRQKILKLEGLQPFTEVYANFVS